MNMDSKFHAIVSADIVSSTSLSVDGLMNLTSDIHKEFSKMKDFLGEKKFWGRVVKGDAIECFVSQPEHSLRVALILKCLIKEFVLEHKSEGSKEFRRYALRFSIGIGGLLSAPGPDGLLIGEAVNYAGRNIDAMGKSLSKLSSVTTPDQDATMALDGIASVLSSMIDNASAKQCQVVRRLLYNMTETEIGEEIGISQGAVSLRSSGADWRLIKKQLSLYETQIKK